MVPVYISKVYSYLYMVQFANSFNIQSPPNASEFPTCRDPSVPRSRRSGALLGGAAAAAAEEEEEEAACYLIVLC